ncbi:oxygen sensor histidine kinase FixL [Stakelama sediminis]|uniref:Sensor protein FixL n=1 Tax=Stakelama sediminis TaxID=463200 RepID=A0A840YTZ9_9SPHN|nr:PAS domain-containing sensor histidine kinase [Stakelama sediminis]MBB5717108.1 PAS domain S-box-containing protein [Stakelama sediminis]
MDRLLGEQAYAQAGATALDPWLELAAEANEIGFFNWDIVNDRLRWNTGAEERLGLKPGTINRFADWRSYVHPEDAQRIEQDVASLSALQPPRLSYQYRFYPPGGDERLINGVAHCVYGDSGNLIQLMGLNIDVTEQEANRLALERSEAQLRMLVETVPDAMVVIDGEGTVHGFNAAAERMFGYTAKTMLGGNVARLMPDELAHRHDASIAAYLNGGQKQIIGRTRTLTARRADGSAFPVELNLGEALDGKRRLFTAFIRDVSERVNATNRLEELRAQFFRSARLNTMGEVAAGLAHEINQPLSAATNYLAAAAIHCEAMQDGEQLRETVMLASAQLSRAGEIIRRLRGFLSDEERTAQHVSVANVIQESIMLSLPSRQRDMIEIKVEFQEDGLSAFVDQIQFQQVLVNLIRNANEAMTQADVTDKRIELRAVRKGHELEISVTDNGGGFTEAMLSKADRPFVTSGRADGMGLGLAICRRIVESQGGSLRIGNAEQGGAEVRFTLPIEGETV